MDPTERPSPFRRRSSSWAAFVVIIVVALSLPLAHGARATTAHPATVPLRMSLPQDPNLEFPGTVDVFNLASAGPDALLDLSYTNLTNELVLYDAAHNASTVVQAYVPGGFNTTIVTPISAGGAFFFGVEDAVTGTESFDEVTVAGAMTAVSLPLVPTDYWSFVYGDKYSLYAAASGNGLYEFNPTTRNVIANFSGLLPTGVNVLALLPVGNLLYLAGSRTPTTGGAYPWFGTLNRTSHAIVSLTRAKSYPSNESGAFYEILEHRGQLYVGGELGTFVSSPFLFQSDYGYLYRYNLTTGQLANLSSLLPIKHAGVFGIEPWRNTIVVSLSRFSEPASFVLSVTGGIFTLGPGGMSFANRTGLLPSTYVINIAYVTSGSAGWFFSGGADTSTGNGQVVAIRL